MATQPMEEKVSILVVDDLADKRLAFQEVLDDLDENLVLVSSGVNVPVCLLVLTLAPAVTVVGFETVGHRHMERALARL